MAQNFDYSRASYFIGNGKYPEGVDEDRAAELAAHMHEAQIDVYMGSFSDDVMRQTAMYADCAGLENITVERSDGLSVNIMENGTLMANYEIDVYLPDDGKDDLLPNGDPAGKLAEYGWDEFDKLEEMAKAQDAQFGANIEAMEQNHGMQKD